MGHELSHVTLRHGTAQATKAQFAQGAAGIFGGIFGGSTGGALLTQGVALGAGGLMLRYSRGDETQADARPHQLARVLAGAERLDGPARSSGRRRSAVRNAASGTR